MTDVSGPSTTVDGVVGNASTPRTSAAALAPGPDGSTQSSTIVKNGSSDTDADWGSAASRL